MGRKLNPVLFRLGINTFWEPNFFFSDSILRYKTFLLNKWLKDFFFARYILFGFVDFIQLVSTYLLVRVYYHHFFVVPGAGPKRRTLLKLWGLTPRQNVGGFCLFSRPDRRRIVKKKRKKKRFFRFFRRAKKTFFRLRRFSFLENRFFFRFFRSVNLARVRYKYEAGLFRNFRLKVAQRKNFSANRFSVRLKKVLGRAKPGSFLLIKNFSFLFWRSIRFKIQFWRFFRVKRFFFSKKRSQPFLVKRRRSSKRLFLSSFYQKLFRLHRKALGKGFSSNKFRRRRVLFLRRKIFHRITKSRSVLSYYRRVINFQKFRSFRRFRLKRGYPFRNRILKNRFFSKFLGNYRSLFFSFFLLKYPSFLLRPRNSQLRLLVLFRQGLRRLVSRSYFFFLQDVRFQFFLLRYLNRFFMFSNLLLFVFNTYRFFYSSMLSNRFMKTVLYDDKSVLMRYRRAFGSTSHYFRVIAQVLQNGYRRFFRGFKKFDGIVLVFVPAVFWKKSSFFLFALRIVLESVSPYRRNLTHRKVFNIFYRILWDVAQLMNLSAGFRIEIFGKIDGSDLTKSLFYHAGLPFSRQRFSVSCHYTMLPVITYTGVFMIRLWML